MAVLTLIGLAGLAGCTFLTRPPGLSGSHGRTGPVGPAMGGGPARPHGPNRATVLAGGGALTDNATDSYVAWGSFLVSGTESAVAIPLPPVGRTLSNLKVSVSKAPRTGASWTFTVDKNKSATVLTCSVGGAATSCSDSSLLAVVTGDKLDLRVTPFGKPALATITWSVTIAP
jgi:hypothetical protein